jgi:hypothetical protein
MEDIMSRRQTWGRDARSDTAEIQVMVRCQGNRVIGAGLQAGKLYLKRIFSPPGISTQLLNYVTEVESGPIGTYPCPNHKEGHTIDAARLREAIYRLSPQGGTKKRGKPPSTGVKAVEFA